MKQRIAIIAPSCPPFSAGGVSSAHFNLGTALRAAGYDVGFFTYGDTRRDSNDPPYLIRRGTPRILEKIISFASRVFFRFLERGSMAYQTCDILTSQWGAWRLRRVLKKFRPDIAVFPDHGCPALAIGTLPGVRSVVISHHNPGRFTSPLLHGKPVSKKDIRWALALENRALRHIDMLLCPTEYMVKEAKKSYKFNGIVHTAPNVIAESAFADVQPRSVARELGMPDDRPVVYIPDAGSSVKGERYVFEIVRRIGKARPDVLFLLSGNIGPVLRCELQADAALTSRIFMPGRLPYLENLAYIASSSLCLSPTLAESFGMALIEAAYFGIPAVTFATGGNTEVVEHEKTGIIVPYLDVDALVEQAVYLLKPEQKGLRESLGASAQMKVRALMHSGLAQYEAAFEELLRSNPCPRP